MTYALGRRVEYYDMPTVRAIVRDAEQNGNRISSFILGVVNSAAFRMAKAEPSATTHAGRDEAVESSHAVEEQPNVHHEASTSPAARS